MTTCTTKIEKGVATLVRPKYAPGLLLEDEDLTSAVNYTRNSLRLLFRSLFGCGVICGLKLNAQLTCQGRKLEVVVEPGVALDCDGNPIQLTESRTVVWDADCAPMPETFWVSICYTECCAMPTDVGCGEDDATTKVYRRIRDGYEIHVAPCKPECACSCEKPDENAEPQDPDACCDRQSSAAAAAPAASQNAAPADDPCDCYKDHNDFKCACECGCTCVLIGKITVTDIENTDYSQVRRIRPMLIAAKDCYCPPSVQSTYSRPGAPEMQNYLPPGQRPIGRRITDLSYRIADRDRAIGELEEKLGQAETRLAIARHEAARARDALDHAAPEHELDAQRNVRQAEAAFEELVAESRLVSRQIDAARAAIALDEETLERAKHERELGTLQAKLSYVDEQITSARGRGIDVADLRELTTRRTEVAEHVKKKMDWLLAPP
jgi:hypothetical protein